MMPSEILAAAADLIRDLAAGASGGPWKVKIAQDRDEEEYSWIVVGPMGSTCMDFSDQGGADARWIAALSPALAPHIERWFRESAESLARHEPAWRDHADVFDEPIVRRSPAEVDALVEHHYGAALGVANSILGSGVDTP